MLETINNLLGAIDDFVWGVPLIVLILATGIYLTIRVKCLQISKLPRAIHYMFHSESEDLDGEVSSFAALCTALSATIGTGNIVGVATAIVAGGPGALFWMWIAAFLGTATKYAEGLLAVKYRTVAEDGHIVGGPFYYIEKGMGEKWKWLAKLFAFFGVGVGLFGIGTFTQVNGITSAANNFFDPNNAHMISLFGRDYSWSVVIAGLILAICVGLVVIGGLKRISQVSQVVVPFMAVIYVIAAITILICNITKIPGAFVTIIQSAFGIRAAAGGALGAVLLAMQKGIARGIFSNEAGLGSAPIAHAATSEKNPVRQGLYGIFEVFADTTVICTMTSLVILMSGTPIEYGQPAGVELTNAAFAMTYGKYASVVVAIGLSLFAGSTILSWGLYGTRCAEYLFGSKVIKPYQILFCIVVVMGAVMDLSLAWDISDTLNACMAIPNLIGLLLLSPVVIKLAKEYSAEHFPEKQKA